MKYSVEMMVGYNASVEVEAENEEEAIEKAKKEVSENPTEYLDSVEIEEITYVG